MLWSRSRSQKRFRILVNVHLDGISSDAEPSVTKLGVVMEHHGPQCDAGGLVCCLQSSGSQGGLIWSNMTVSTIFAELLIFLQSNLIRCDCFYHICRTADLFAIKFNRLVHLCKLECFVWKLGCCFQGQDHSKGSKFYWIFMYLISSVPVISRQPNNVCWFAIHNNQTKYNKLGIYWHWHFYLHYH